MFPHNFLPEEKEGGRTIESQNPSQCTAENPTSCQDIQPKLPENLGKINGEEEDDHPKFQEGQNPKFEEEEEGYRTPTSPEHRIPVITQCPPAPKRPRPHHSELERKLPQAVCRRLQFDAMKEVEFIFWRVTPDKVVEKKTKKTRTNENDQI